MKSLFENWRHYLKENKINTRDEIIDFIKNNPDQNINIDSPKGSIKGFGGADEKLPFDYGEWPHLNNPADNMGWDLIIVPSATKDDLNLIPVGYVEYDPELKPKKIGNDKIIIAPEGNYLQSDKKIIDDFFSSVEHIKKPTWLQGDKDENHERTT